MSFRLFVYYCAVIGGWAALAGWAIGLALAPDTTPLGRALIRATCVGMVVALGLAVVDGLWNLSVHQVGQVAWRGIVGAFAGVLASIPGAFLGQLLVNATEKDGLAMVGWALTGLLIGGSVGTYDTLARMFRGEWLGGALRKVGHGAMGGFAGGLLGGGLYVLIRGNLRLGGRDPDDLFSGSALGFVVLGLSIGLCVGLAQVILKEAWIRIESGFRAGRECILAKQETTIGRAEACDIGLFRDVGVARLHARIVQQGHRYMIADAGAPSGTYLNDRLVAQPTALQSGDTIRVGNCVLKFRERKRRSD